MSLSGSVMWPWKSTGDNRHQRDSSHPNRSTRSSGGAHHAIACSPTRLSFTRPPKARSLVVRAGTGRSSSPADIRIFRSVSRTSMPGRHRMKRGEISTKDCRSIKSLRRAQACNLRASACLCPRWPLLSADKEFPCPPAGVDWRTTQERSK